MRYNKIRKMDISNGPGVRTSIFVQGCTFNCKNCFNPETHDFRGGKEFTEETIEKILDLSSKDYIVGLSILGGDPMHPKNLEETTKLAKAFKKRFPEKNIWLWTGFQYEDVEDKEILNYIDVLIDGKYIDELHNPTLKWKGSSNQRVIDIRKTKQKKKINEGKLVSIIEKSPNRIEPKCQYYNICGGCNTEHISYNKSVIYKKEIVKNIFNKYCNMNIEPSIIYDANNTYNYRNKITLRIKNGKLSLVGDTLINIDYCYLVNNNINEVIKLLNSICLDGVNEVVIRGTDDIMVIIKGDINSSSIISILDGKVNSIFINNIKVYGNDHIIINVGIYSYAVYADSFFQVNTNMIDKLYNKVLEYAGTGNKLLDLYCGSGTIGIYLAHNFNTVIGIEQNKDAIKGANLNKKINNIHNISFICKQVSEINQIESNVVVVDPPRSGLDNTIMNKIMNSNIDKLVYVSCNPITLSRDINILKNKYNLVDITLYDMFPNTNHVESVCLFKIK